MFTTRKTFFRLSQACLIGAAVAVAGFSSLAHAQSNLHANAYTQGTKIHIAPGQQRHLGHEALHVAKQKTGRIASEASKLNTFKKANTVSRASKAAKAAKAAKTANTVRKAAKAAKIAKFAVAGTGVGAVVGVGASLAGVDPVEMATLKATNPAEYNRRMDALKKHPVKYMGNNIKNNSRKAATTVANTTKKAGCGVGNVFSRRATRRAASFSTSSFGTGRRLRVGRLLSFDPR